MMRLRKRKGSLFLVIVFGSMMAWVVVSMLTVATTLYSDTKDTAKIYSDIQSYRAGMEMSCYQYVSDLQGVTVTRDLDSDWISVSGEAIYSQALDEIKSALGSDEDSNVWFVSDLTTALSGANLSNPTVLTTLLGKIAGVRQSFSLVVPEPLQLNWEDPDSYRDRDRAYVALSPFVVEVNLSVKGETLHESFIVSGIFMDLMISKTDVGGNTHEVATIRLTEKEEGVCISRAQIEEA